MDTKAVLLTLTNTLLPDPNLRKAAELQLQEQVRLKCWDLDDEIFFFFMNRFLYSNQQFPLQPGYSVALLQILTSAEIDLTIRIAAAIRFRELVISNWEVDEAERQKVLQISPAEQQIIKCKLVQKKNSTF